MITEQEFQERLDAKLRDLLDFCAGHWGEAPELEAAVTPSMLVSCSFDLGDFPHRGRSFLVHPGNIARRGPEKIALEIVQEVASHRNQCGRCGLGMPAIQNRTWAVERGSISRMSEEDRTRYLVPPDEPERMLFPSFARRLDAALAALGAGK